MFYAQRDINPSPKNVTSKSPNEKALLMQPLIAKKMAMAFWFTVCNIFFVFELYSAYYQVLIILTAKCQLFLHIGTLRHCNDWSEPKIFRSQNLC